MAVNADKPHLWKADISRSVDFYNEWFINFAPGVYRETRAEAVEQVKDALELTANLTNIEPEVLREHPSVLPMLRMATAPPLARDRLIGLAGVSTGLIRSIEIDKRIPARMAAATVDESLRKISDLIMRLADKDIFPWLESGHSPEAEEIYRAATVVADRLCGAVADPIVRNAQERRQLAVIKGWLEQRGYSQVKPGTRLAFDKMEPGTFSFRLNIPIKLSGGETSINIPVDAVVKPLRSEADELPLLIEAKSAGDFANTNKRRKEEAIKVTQLRSTYGARVRFILFLCGYFDSGYLGYEAAEGIDWVWEHRIDQLSEFGL
jgi:hypothetical protein